MRHFGVGLIVVAECTCRRWLSDGTWGAIGGAVESSMAVDDGRSKGALQDSTMGVDTLQDSMMGVFLEDKEEDDKVDKVGMCCI